MTREKRNIAILKHIESELNLDGNVHEGIRLLHNYIVELEAVVAPPPPLPADFSEADRAELWAWHKANNP